jgi:hypothetical protein
MTPQIELQYVYYKAQTRQSSMSKNKWYSHVHSSITYGLIVNEVCHKRLINEIRYKE